jgi:hypothetical protein
MKILSFDVGIVNLAYCIFDSSNSKMSHWEIITLQNHNDYNKIYINLINELDNRTHLINDIDIVLIEKQPSFNPKMRIIAGCLQTYFIIRGIVDASSPENAIKSVKFFSPKHKLKCYNGPELVIDSKAKGKYALTKKMGILICEVKLKEYSESPEIIKLFRESKKKDDLSDCYLQALTYAMFEKEIDSTLIKGKVKLNVSKTEIKNELKKILDSSNFKFNNFNDHIPENLKKNIENKYSVYFPFNDKEQIKNLLTLMNMKKYIKQIN